MLTPSFGLAATERVLPRLALDFTTAALDARVTLTRLGNTATVIDSSGVIVGVNADVPRFEFDPVTLSCKGLLVELTRTNLLLNSLINGTSLATQTVTVAASTYTFSFYGTGSVVLSGTHSATVNGSGAYPTRTTYTFTPTAGSLTLTVTGAVQFANLELGSFASSFIPTDGTTKTRNADVATMTGTNFSSWFNPAQGAFVYWMTKLGSYLVDISATDGTSSNTLGIESAANNDIEGLVKTSSTTNANPFSAAGTVSVGTPFKAGLLYNTNYVYGAINGVKMTSANPDTSVTLPVVDRLQIGQLGSGNRQGFLLQKLFYYPQQLTNNELNAFTK